MLILFYILLVLNIGRCTDDHIFETKTVGVGQSVTLTCPRNRLSLSSLFWIRLVSGTFPEILGATYAVDLGVDVETRRITAKQGPGTFVLYITETRIRDTAVYYCIKVTQSKMTFLRGTFLRIKGPEPDITAVTQDPSDPVRPGDSVTLQCSVLSDSEKKTCPEEHRVYWFRAASDESHPSVIYAQVNSSDGCEKSPEAHSPQKCVYSFSKDVSSSDAGTYYCAVATCGEILFGNGTKVDIEGASTCSQDAVAVIFLLCAVLAISLIVVAVLIYAMKKKENDCYSAAVAVQRNSGGRKSQQRDEDTQVYSAVVFTVMKTGSGAIKDSRAAERQRIYAAVKAFGLD
ncbi:uncharacterized protein LOC125895073 [Epinephelus fuscoguttatus]|uniref:uncharacterized protein LOC125895073 n=1 Tax=Epinephelus fuscoguttatus TaxID=293821 RepID=UPI0020D1CE95|nr:uncharacterized protein LOC125895073 [Epinephelus fuscoguttatus]